MTSALEETFYLLCLAHGFPDPEREYLLVPGRRWRADFAWHDKLLAVEIEGGVWSNGRHTRGGGFTSDCEKYNEAQLLGWRVLRFTGEHLNNGYAMACLGRAWNG
jgi:hypothetical protein